MKDTDRPRQIAPGRPRRLTKAESAQFKWRTIILPSALGSIGFIGGLSLLHSLLIAVFAVPPLPEDVLKLWLPLFLPWVVILGVLRRRLKLLRWYRDWFTGAMLVWFVISCPSIIAQHYIADAVGKLTRVTRISEVRGLPQSRFWMASSWTGDKRGALRSVEMSVSGKHSEYFDITVRYAVPLTDPNTKRDSQSPSAWLALKYNRRLNNSSDPASKQSAVNDLWSEAARKLAADDLRWVTFFSIEGNTRARRAIESMLRDASAPAAPLLAPHDGEFEDRTGSSLPWAFGTFAIGFTLWCAVILLVRLDSSRVREWQIGDSSADKIAGLWLLTPRDGYVVTPVLLFLNVAVWLVMASQDVGLGHTSANDLITWGAAYRPLIAQGEFWRLITSSFVHANLLHIVNNAVMLVLIGSVMEQSVRSSWYAAVYALSGLVGISVSVAWHPNTAIVGASAAIFGLAGYGIVELLIRRDSIGAAPALLKIAAVYLGINLVIGIVLPGVDLVAHVAGLGTGAALGVFRCLVPALRTGDR
ncbi:rhomboid family intramembrane serine protease [Opitutus sp. ER46]|uniref:rhomboid family intramembrane serine protease n=1 Tax=Opitutus sp. ER46 TaxID=2161864 RepID=UPI000D31CFA6|nr:rhomboid family intramembrane serine protease [Opitutus sp. ER46]PTX94603.1 hypothetical protein DB354_12800 [Opitutus sp. ER46]